MLQQQADAKYRMKNVLAAVLLVALVLLVYGQVLDHDFVAWDDQIHTYLNPLLSPITPAHLAQFWRQPYMNLYVPLSYMLFAALSILAHINGPSAAFTDRGVPLNPHVFHAASLILHGINALLVYALLERLFKRPFAALAGAAMFAVHPLQVESVAWISELRGLLSAFFSLLALLAYVHREPATGKRDALRLVAAIALTVLAMLCKPSAIVTPLIAGAIDLGMLERKPREALMRAGIWQLSLAPFFLVTSLSQTNPAGFLTPYPHLARPLIALDSLSFYLFKTVYPFPLTIDYGRTPADVTHHWWGYITWLLPVALTVIAYFARKRAPAAATAFAVFCLALLPELGLVEFAFQYYSTVADRYAYLAMIGGGIAAAWLWTVADRTWRPWPVAVLVLAYAMVAFQQVDVWRDTDTLFRHTIAINPNSAVGHAGLGDELAAHGHVAAAAVEYRVAMQLHPEHYSYYFALAAADSRLGHDDEAAVMYRKSIELFPDFYDGRLGLAALEQRHGQVDQAVVLLQQADKISPADPRAAYELAKICISRKQPADAIALCREAVRRNKYYSPAYILLAQLLAASGQTAEAAVNYESALKIDPNDSMTAYNLAALYGKLGRSDDALAMYRRSVANGLGFAPAHIAYGVALAQSGDLQDAVTEFSNALQIDPTSTAARQDLQLAEQQMSKR